MPFWGWLAYCHLVVAAAALVMIQPQWIVQFRVAGLVGWMDVKCAPCESDTNVLLIRIEPLLMEYYVMTIISWAVSMLYESVVFFNCDLFYFITWLPGWLQQHLFAKTFHKFMIVLVNVNINSWLEGGQSNNLANFPFKRTHFESSMMESRTTQDNYICLHNTYSLCPFPSYHPGLSFSDISTSINTLRINWKAF